jgi:hypothetical protein
LDLAVHFVPVVEQNINFSFFGNAGVPHFLLDKIDIPIEFSHSYFEPFDAYVFFQEHFEHS